MNTVTFQELVQNLNRTRTDGDFTLDNLKDEATLMAVEQNLRNHGITEFMPGRLGGTSALVTGLPDGRVLRLVSNTLEKPIDGNDWTVIQPVEKLGTAAGIESEIFPKVLTLDKAIRQNLVSPQQAAGMIKSLIAHAARNNELLWDAKPENFAVLPDAGGSWVPFILDKGAKVHMREMNGGKIGNDVHTNLDKFRTTLSDNLAKLGCPDPRIAADPAAYLGAIQKETPPLSYDFEGIQKNYVQAAGRNRQFFHGTQTAIHDVGKSRPEPILPKLLTYAGAALAVIGGGVAVAAGTLASPLALGLLGAALLSFGAGKLADPQTHESSTESAATSSQSSAPVSCEMPMHDLGRRDGKTWVKASQAKEASLSRVV